MKVKNIGKNSRKRDFEENVDRFCALIFVHRQINTLFIGQLVTAILTLCFTSCLSNFEHFIKIAFLNLECSLCISNHLCLMNYVVISSVVWYVHI